jgi:hypothetical protein
MRRILVVLLLLAVASPARATSALRVRWNRCDVAGSTIRTFDCADDDGADTLVVSYLPYSSTARIHWTWFSLSFCTGIAAPDWWRVFAVGDCRLGAITALPADPHSACGIAWNPGGGSSVSIDGGTADMPNGMRLYVTISPANASDSQDLVTGQEVELGRVIIDHSHSSGPDACLGCSIPVDVHADVAEFGSLDGSGFGATGDDDVKWQDAGIWCRALTPVRSRTWGQLKSAYR